jgi:small subunit ribosomal protein S17
VSEKDHKEKKSRPVKLVVTSDKMNKSRVGTIEHLVKHARYGKYMRRRTKLMFHDEKNESRQGDLVLVAQTRPLSGRKRFTLLQVVKKGED